MIDERSYLAVLHEELVPAQGCTEPIALAYCSAQARKALGTDPENIRVLASGNIIKNVKSVVVPGPTAAGASRPRRCSAPWPATRRKSWRF